MIIQFMEKNSTHHIFAQEEREHYNVHIKENTIPMERKEHDALHVVFNNNHPKEQLLKIIELNKSVIASDILAVLQEILSLPEDEFYIEGIIRIKQQREE